MKIFILNLIFLPLLAIAECGDSVIVMVGSNMQGTTNKVVRHYDLNGNETAYFNYKYNSGIWDNDNKQITVRNTQGKIVAVYMISGNNQIWADTIDEKLFFYNSNGDIDSSIYNDIQYGYSAYDKYVYDVSFHLIKHSNYSFVNGAWNNRSREEHYYNVLGDDTLELTFTGNLNVWNPDHRNNRVYSTNHEVIHMTDEQYNGTAWVNYISYDFHYSGGLLDSTIWLISAQQYLSVIGYDSLDRKVSETTYQWNGLAYNFYFQSDSTLYDSAGRIVFHFDESGQYENTYDSAGYLISYYEIYSTGGSSTWQYSYSNGLLVSAHYLSTSMGGNVSEGDVYYYYAEVYGSSISCNGNTVTLTTDTCSSYSYLWSNGATTPSINVHSGTFTVTVTDSAGISYTSPFFVVRNVAASTANLNDTTICVFDTLQLFPGEFELYSWQDGSTDSTLFVTSSMPNQTNYYVTVMDSNACVSSDTATVIVDICNRVEEHVVFIQKIYPSPVSDILNIILNSDQSEEMRIFGIDGELAGTFKLNNGLNSINVNNLQAGIYYIVVNTAYKPFIQSVVKL